MPRRPRAGLSRQRVLRAALDLVDRHGTDALTMRRLGRELGVEAMSLYGYVRSKQDLIEGVVEQVFKEMPLITPGRGPWQERLRIHVATYRSVLLRHPNAVRLVAGRPVVTEGTAAFVESALVELQSIGLDLRTADRVLDVIASFTIGHVSEQVGNASRTREIEGGRRSDPPKAPEVPDQPDAADPAADPPDPERFPNVSAVLRLPPGDPDAEFAFGFEFIVAGIERLLAERIDPPGR